MRTNSPKNAAFYCSFLNLKSAKAGIYLGLNERRTVVHKEIHTIVLMNYMLLVTQWVEIVAIYIRFELVNCGQSRSIYAAE
jgi:hypothetical protein